MAEARERILDWLDEKADLGFTEWHSDVYYQKDVTPLLTLVEWSRTTTRSPTAPRWCSISCCSTSPCISTTATSAPPTAVRT